MRESLELSLTVEGQSMTRTVNIVEFQVNYY